MGAFHPALCLGSASTRNRDAWCWVGAPGAHGFHHGKWPLASRKRHFFPLRGRVTASAVYHPTCMPEKSSYTCRQIHWNRVPDRKESCSRHTLCRKFSKHKDFRSTELYSAQKCFDSKSISALIVRCCLQRPASEGPKPSQSQNPDLSQIPRSLNSVRSLSCRPLFLSKLQK